MDLLNPFLEAGWVEKVAARRPGDMRSRRHERHRLAPGVSGEIAQIYSNAG
jgi:hypothetical protein